TSTSSDYTAFWATTTDPDPSLAEGIWNAGPAGIELVARLGNEAPGTGGRVFRAFNGYGLTPPPVYQDDYLDPYRFDAFVVNQTGDVVFTAYIDPLDQADIYSDAGLWIQDATGLSLVALTDDVAPGTAAEPFLYFNHINFNAAGQVAFDASLDIVDPTRDHGIWVGLPGSLNLVVREGDPAPGTAGETFDILVMGPSLNDSGEIAFFAKLRESGTYGLWAATVDGSLSLIARVGESVEVKSGDYRTIGTIMPVYGGLGSYSWFNAFNGTGQLTFASTFTDGTDAILLGSPLTTSPNQLPVASAGPDQSIAESNTTVLDGTASHDPDGTILSFVWSVDGVQIASDPKTTVGPLAAGVHAVTLTVTDRNGASVSDDMILTVIANLPPVVNAGPDQTVDYTQLVAFDGTATFDPEGDALTYVWSVDYCRAASPAPGETEPAPTETAPGEYPNCPDFATGPTPTDGPFVIGVHTITLTATDIHGASATDEMMLTVTNDSPVANAGPDQTVQTLEAVTLDGSDSTDTENDIVSYVWSVGGVQIATGSTPVVGPFDAGVHTITLTVKDYYSVTATDEVVVTVLNRAPVANAGLDQTVNHAQSLTLAGSGSDPEGAALSYAWTLNGVQIATGADPVVGPFEVGVHTLTLTVTDDKGATATDRMIVTVTNAPPLANAGLDRTANHAQTVTLDGAGSSDPEGGALTYVWTLSGVQIAAGANPVVGPFDVGVHTVTLTVTDDHGATATDSMVITVINETPVASAGPDQSVSVKRRTTLVTLDGSASSDPEGGVLSYLWTKDGQTVGTGAIVQLDLGAGVHVFTLTVTDDHGAVASDSAVVTVSKNRWGS
ncbi:MAG: PKD domain-containing protein, partial [Gemmatimonadota bacterium]|nr:PKD domain-containing protein [Gemmatimonadota bacterium]